MKINFDWHEFMSKKEREKTSYNIENRPSLNTKTRKAEGAYNRTIVDISDKVTDDFHYADQGMVTEKLKSMIGNEDYVSIQRDFMTVMSNSMSASDFQKMKEEGFDISSMEPEQAVTILDKIKTVLAQSGIHIRGYNDNLSVDKLTEIMGSGGYAQTIARELSYADVPVTEENLEQMDKVAEQAFTTKTPQEGVIVYLLSQHMEPTLANLYQAEHSGGSVRRQPAMAGYASGGYDRQGGNTTGVRKTVVSSKDYEQIEKEIKNRVQKDGLEVSSQNLEHGKWLLEHGIPVTGENIKLLQDIRSIEFPLDMKQVLRQAAYAIGEGKSPFSVNLNQKESGVYEQAFRLKERFQNLSYEGVDYAAANQKELHLENMEAYRSDMGSMVPRLEARKLLEEVRLKMTVEANVKLLQSGYHIETAPMEELIHQLEEATESINKNLFGTESAREKGVLYGQTQENLKVLPTLPISVIGKIPFMEKTAISAVIEEGQLLKAAYEKANETYEAIMTAPRSDLGDSIKKAFRNVDDILQDMDLEVNESNRRAIRIMGYNQITITEENLEKIKAADRQVRNIIEGLKPGMTLSMIREGKNPLEMSMEEVQQYITEHENEFINDTEKFSEFLYKLNKKKSITGEEREAYIGIYRMLRQIEKTDGAVIGSLLEQNAEMNFSNLLSAVRTRRAKHTDIKVEDSTGILAKVNRKGTSISEQIERAYDAVRSTLKDTSITPDKVLEDVKRMQRDEGLEKQFLENKMQEIRENMKFFGNEKEYLEMYHQPVTFDTLASVMALNENRGMTFKKAVELQQNLWENNIGEMEEDILKEAEEFLSSMEKEETREESYDNLISHTKQILERVWENSNPEYTDIRQMQSVYKQLTVAAGLAKEENYEIPVKLGEEITSINLKIVHSTKEKGEVRITMDTKDFGKVDARFVETDDGLEGSILTDYMDGKERLQLQAKELQKALNEALKETKTEVRSLFFGTNEKLDINSLSKGVKEEKSEVSLLYKVAKQFIYYVKDVEEA